MKTSKLIFLFLAYAFVCSLNVQGAGAAQWEKAFGGEGYKKHEFSYFDFYYPEKCMAPGGKKAEANGPFYSEEEKVERLKIDLRNAEEEKLDIEAQIAWLEDTDEKEMKIAKEKLAAATEEVKRLKEAVALLDPNFAAKEGIDVSKLNAEKGQEAKKPVKKGKELHEEETYKYYNFEELNENLENIYRDATERLNCYDMVNYSVSHAKIYFVTNPKMFASLKGKDRLTPAKNVYTDRKARSVLVFVSPNISKRLLESVGYGIASMVLEEHLALSNPKGELCDAFKVGFAALCSGLGDCVEPNKIVESKYLLENKLLLPSELFLPSKLEDPERRLYFTRQSKAVVSYIYNASKDKFISYVKTVSGGNSGFRNSFQNLYVSKVWANNYDDFCNDLSFRVFFPLTKEATDPEAYAEWNKAIAEEDANFSGGTEKDKKLKPRRRIHWRNGHKYITYEER